MKNKIISIDLPLKVEFYDVDSMRIVWHGNYAKYLEQARCALLDKIGYNYLEMEESGYAWPIVSMQLKYIRTLKFNQEFIVRASLIEYENRIRIKYTILDPNTGQKINSAETIQMAVNLETAESQLVSPPCLIELVEGYLRKNATSADAVEMRL